MAFIGNQPALSYTSFAKQDFTTSATTSYTLDNPVANANELALFINFVRQEPTTAYSASGTSLTLTSATSATDDMYCVFLGKAVQTVNPPNASVGASQIVDSSIALGKLSATGTKDATTFLRGDNTFASAGGDNTPSFAAYVGSNQSISDRTNTKVNFTTEHFDSDGKYDTSNKRFTPTVAGKYFISAGFNGSTDQTTKLYIFIYVNGSPSFSSMTLENVKYRDNDSFIQVNRILTLDTDDYVEIFVRHEQGSTATLQTNGSWFQAFKLIT